MFILASRLISLPIAALASQSKIGRVSDLIIDPTSGRLIALVIRENFFSRAKFLSLSDILEFDPRGLVIKDSQVLVPPEEIVRAKEIIKSKIKILGARAMTESRKNLGKVADLLIDSETGMVVKYYLKNIFQDRIIPAQNIVLISRKGVIVKDELPPLKTIGVPA